MKLSDEEYMDLCKRCWHSYIAFPAADFELAYANNVSPLDACTAIWSVHRKELSLTDPEASPTQGADAQDIRSIEDWEKRYLPNGLPELPVIFELVGADARPVAIYQIRASRFVSDWTDVSSLDPRFHDYPEDLRRIVYATRDAAPSGAPITHHEFGITSTDCAAFARLYSMMEDGEGYDVPKEKMERLAEIGLIRKVRGSVYEFTKFGLAMQDSLIAASAPREKA